MPDLTLKTSEKKTHITIESRHFTHHSRFSFGLHVPCACSGTVHTLVDARTGHAAGGRAGRRTDRGADHRRSDEVDARADLDLERLRVHACARVWEEE